MNDTEVRQGLEETRESILERRVRLARHTDHREAPLPQDFAEQAIELENDETMVALSIELDLELKQVDYALQRLSDGTYSNCSDCGTAINPERLRALPSTALCIRCADAA